MNPSDNTSEDADQVEGWPAHADPWTAGMEVPPDAGRYRTALVAVMSRIPPHWGRVIACEAGWFPLIARLHEDLLALDRNYVVLQVKEKFAALRYYAGTSTDDPLLQDRFSVLLDNAERLSRTICEYCGAAGRLSVSDDAENPVYKTMCEACTVEVAAAGGLSYRPYVARSARPPQ